MNQDILTKAKNWATNDYIEANDRAEIAELIEKNDESELTERFYKDLEFGTGGLRAILGNGLNRINIYHPQGNTSSMQYDHSK